jgi:hypothetical protein
MRTYAALMTLPLVAFWGIGCGSVDKVTEDDRVVLDHIRQIGELQTAILSAFSAGGPIPGAELASLLSLVADSTAGAETLQANWGPPKEPVPYSPEAAKLAREKSTGSHKVGFWGWLAGAALGAGGLALTVARMFGRFIPGFGPVFSVVESTMEAIENWMRKQKADGKADVAGGLAVVLEAAHKNAKVGAWVDAKLAKLKDRLGVDIAAISSTDPDGGTPKA